jgi:hypothetical protein
MAGIARRLDRQGPEVGILRQDAGLLQGAARLLEAGAKWAKMFICVSDVPRRAGMAYPLSQSRRVVKQGAMSFDRHPVGHAGDEIADHSAFFLGFRALVPLLGQAGGIGQEVPEQVLDDLARPVHHVLNARVQIELRKQETA